MLNYNCYLFMATPSNFEFLAIYPIGRGGGGGDLTPIITESSGNLGLFSRLDNS